MAGPLRIEFAGAISHDAAVDALNATTDVPWADLAAAESQANADLVTATQGAMVTRTAVSLAAWKAQQISQAQADETKANADAAADADKQNSKGASHQRWRI
jgi:hypothetical protein